MVWVFILYALFGSVFSVSKIGLLHSTPLFFVGFRFFIGGGLILGWLSFVKRTSLRPPKGTLLRITALGFFNVFLTNVFEIWGLQYLTSFKTCFFFGLTPFFTALLSYFLLSERLSAKKWLGLFVGVLGFLPILFSEGTGEEGLFHLFFFSWAEIIVILAVLSSAYGWVLLRQLVCEEKCSPLFVNGIGMVFGGAAALSLSLLTEPSPHIFPSGWLPFFSCILFLVLTSCFAAYNLYGYLLKKFTATFMSFAGYLTPFFAALFGFIFLGERVDASFFLSSAILFVGLSLFYQEEMREGVRVRAGAS